MIDYINRFVRTRRSQSVRSKDARKRSSDEPLDSLLSYDPYPDEHWTFEDTGRVHLNGVDIGGMVESERDDVGFLCGVSRGLQNYQLFVWGNGGKGKAEFNAQVSALQDKVHRRLGDAYDSLTCGLDFESKGGDFWLNNINVRKAIHLFYMNPTEKFRRYLSGLRDKLALILGSVSSSKRYDGVAKEADILYKDIGLALEYIPADAPRRLVSRDRHN